MKTINQTYKSHINNISKDVAKIIGNHLLLPFCIWAIFSMYTVRAQTNLNQKIDSLKLKARTSTIDTNTVYLYSDISYYYNSINSDSSLFYAKKGYFLSKEISFLKGELENIANIAAAYHLYGDYKQALEWSKKGLELAEKHHKTWELFNFNHQIGNLYGATGEYRKAILIHQKNIKISEQEQEPEWKAVTLESIGVINFEIGNTSEAITHYTKALDLRKSLDFKDSTLIAKLYGNLSNGYSSLNKFDQAIAYMYKALLIFKELDQKADISKAYGNLGEMYFRKEEYDKAEQYITWSMELAQEINNHSTLSRDYHTLGKVELKRGRYDQAMIHFQKGLKYALNSEDRGFEINVRMAIVKTLEKQGNYSKAYSDLVQLNALRDSVVGLEKLKIIEKLQIAFDVEKKDAEIALLQKDQQIQKIEKDNLLKLQSILIISGLLLLILLAALFNRFKNSQKLLKTIRKKNTENELLVQEIHHRVKNNLQIVLSLLGSYSDRKGVDQNTVQVLTDTQNKIKSMALIHQNLYGNGNFNSTSTSLYFRSLIENIQQTYVGGMSKSITLNTDIEDVSLQTRLAIPLGLIVNELITNAYKYAFKNEDDNNQVDIVFNQSDKGALHLNIKDNGIGVSDTFDLENAASFGMQIVKGLVEQLGGQIDITTTKFGLGYEIVIPA